MCTPWIDVVVVKLLGKNIEYNTMNEWLPRVWKLQGDFNIMDNHNVFYIVMFEHDTNKEKAISDGYWMIFDRYLVVFHWTLEFLLNQIRGWIK